MSKSGRPVFILLFVFVYGAARSAGAQPHYLEARIRIEPASVSATVTGKWTPEVKARRNLSFVAAGIGAPDLGRRISSLSLKDADGRPVPHKAFNPAEYIAEADFEAFSYKIDLKPPLDPRSAAHTSWIGTKEGLILADDILPHIPGSGPKPAVLFFEIADGWKLTGSTPPADIGFFPVPDLEDAVFIIGQNIRSTTDTTAKNGLSLAASGEWLFSDAEAGSMVAEVYRQYTRIFDGEPGRRSWLVLIPIPQTGVQKGVWEAETRGSTVIIASSDMPFKTQSLQRLHEQLRHEIFHLWLPNGVNLTGLYDWFYEGFALYQSLKTAVALNRIRFEDFLDTLSRAFNIDRSQTRRLSLIAASQERWNGADTQLYARGMVIAFLSDLILLEGSRGKISVEVLLAKLFSVHKHPAAAADANTAVLKLFDTDPRLVALANDYIRGDKPVDWIGILGTAGLENEPGTNRGNLRIKPKLSGRQKAVLDKLGYNNWRKLTRK